MSLAAIYTLLYAADRMHHSDTPRRVVPAGQNDDEIKAEIERKQTLSETRQFVAVGKRKKFKR